MQMRFTELDSTVNNVSSSLQGHLAVTLPKSDVIRSQSPELLIVSCLIWNCISMKCSNQHWNCTDLCFKKWKYILVYLGW